MTATISLRLRRPRPDRRLVALLEQTWQSVPAYRELWQSAGVTPDRLRQVRSASDLSTLPVVDKAQLRRFPVAARCALPTSSVRLERTSGSTGEPFTIPLEAASRQRRRLRFLRALLGCGYRPGQRALILTTHEAPAFGAVLGWSCVDIALGSEALVERYCELRPRLLYGPLNSLILLARGLESVAARAPRPARVISTAEQLDAADRRRLRAAYGCDPADFYGMSETGLVAVRRPGRRQFTVAGRRFLLEFLDCPGAPGLERLLVTDLGGGAMPLIRFDTGDLVERDRSHPDSPIVGFRGRSVDCLRLPDGRLVSPYRITLALEEVAGLRRYQVIQRRDLSVDVLLWTGGAEPRSIRRQADERLRALLGAEADIRLQAILGEPDSGARKFRPVSSEASQQA
jgi:phenylacetate-CoA ligase